MGESKRLFPIPAFFRVGEEEFKILKLGTEGFLLEWDGALSLHTNQRGEIELVGDFIFPYDGYNYLIVKDVRLTCENPIYGFEPDDFEQLPRDLFCKFVSLSKEQEEFFQLLVKNFLLKKIIAIPSEFMNYTKDEEVRRELLELQRKMEQKKKLKRYAVVGTLTAGVVAFLSLVPSIITTFWNSASTLTVRYIEKSSKNQSATAETVSAPKERNTLSESGLNSKEAKEIASSLKAKKDKTKSFVILAQEDEEALKPKEAPKPLVSYLYSDARASIKSPAKNVDTSELSSSEKYYCVQVASDKNLKNLLNKAKSFASYPFVRVEKIGNFYTLRVGFWDDKDEAQSALRSIKRAVKGAFSRTCIYKPERWVYPERG